MIDISRLPASVPAVIRAFANGNAMRELRPRYGAGRIRDGAAGRAARSPAELIGTLMRVVDEEQE